MLSSEINLRYQVAMPEPHTHYYEISLEYSGFASGTRQDFKLPVWTPGSYFLREYAQHVEGVLAYNQEGDRLPCIKITKNTWQVSPPSNCQYIRFIYRVYAYDWTVRTAFLDADQAYINGAALFVYPSNARDLPALLELIPHPNWQNISTALPVYQDNIWQRYSPNYDILVDSPVLVGNHRRIFFEAAGIPHEFALFGLNQVDNFEQLIQDSQKIVEASAAIFDHHPCEHYLFMSHFGEKGGGGLEHANSTSLQFPRERFLNDEGYERFLSLVAHEYFHLWNVKRLAPAPLDYFDYDQENYCSMLWVVEGFTSYYENVVLRKARLLSEEAFTEKILELIRDIEARPGLAVQSLAESSFDAWIKAYRPNANSANSQISYYTKGAVIAFMLDAEIIAQSKGKQNLDDFMKAFYHKFHLQLNRAYKEEELQTALAEYLSSEKVAQFFQDYIYDTKPIDYAYYFNLIGLNLRQESDTQLKSGLEMDGSRVRYVKRQAAAERAGINVGDQIIAINNERVQDWERWLRQSQAGDILQVTLLRDGLLREVELELSASEQRLFKIDLPEAKSPEYLCWQR